jgi:cation:H+ antiporter
MGILAATGSIALGIVTLVVGGELLVRGAASLARAARVSSLVIGLTVVAFGTSAPEMAVSVQAALKGSAEVAVGNVVGSNIFNILFVLGLSALVAQLVVSMALVRRDVPLMILASLVFWLVCLDGSVNRVEGLVGVILLVAWTTWLVLASRKESADQLAKGADPDKLADLPASQPVWLAVVLVLAGLGVLIFGADRLVEGSIAIARTLKVSELIIGLTIVAAGTSLPELVTSVMASYKGERDISVGNLIGSNVFNILGVMGMSGLVSPRPVAVSSDCLHFDMLVMIAVAFACLPIFLSGIILWWEGALFVAYYILYVWYLVLYQTGSEYLKTFEWVMAVFVAPLVVLTVGVSLWQGLQARLARRAEV